MMADRLTTTPAFDAFVVAAWRTDFFTNFAYPRSAWLGFVERLLREEYPQASRADLNLTARGLAPFPLADGPNVP